MAKKGAKGGGTIRKKTVTRSGKEYTYWEARVTTGRDPGTGKQIQRSFTGKTQKGVREKMQAAAVEVNQGTYTAPQRMTTGRVGGGLPGQREARHSGNLPGQHQKPHQARAGGRLPGSAPPPHCPGLC